MLAAACGLFTIALSPIPGVRTAAADQAPTVTVSTTSGITDGQTVAVTVKTNDGVPVYKAEAALCRGDVTYAASSGTPPSDFGPDGPDCPGPSHPISSSADAYVADSTTYQNAPTADGETFLFRLGTGVTEWLDANTGAEQSLTCDPTHSCALVVELQYRPTTDVNQPKQWKPFVFPIQYGSNDPIAGCGGAAPSVLDTGGSDRMTDAWVAWTVNACATHASRGAPSRASFIGEGQAVQQFGRGSLDLAYTAGGYGGAMDLAHDVPAADRRAAIAVPLALNAAVVGVGGGIKPPTSAKVPYKNLKLSAAEGAAMFGGGRQGVENQAAPDSTSDAPRTYADAIAARNPEIQQHGGSSGLFDSSATMFVGAAAEAEAFSWYGTRYFKQLAPNAWKVPDLPSFVGDRGKPRGIDAELASAQPTFEGAIALLSGRPALRKGLIGPGPSSEGGIWVLTDLETARALSLTPVQMEDAAGNFVAPRADELRASVPAMRADDQGVLVSDPRNTATVGGVRPYPMTFVEYALVPAEPLRNDDCSPRTASQKLLTDWLSYITGEGQAHLPEGMVALPDDLRASAAAQLKKVGASPVTGSCATASTHQGAPALAVAATPAAAFADQIATGDVAASLALAATLSPAVLERALLASILGMTPLGGAPAIATADPPAKTLIQELAAIPRYVAARSPSWLRAALAVAALMGLITFALRASSRAA